MQGTDLVKTRHKIIPILFLIALVTIYLLSFAAFFCGYPHMFGFWNLRFDYLGLLPLQIGLSGGAFALYFALRSQYRLKKGKPAGLPLDVISSAFICMVFQLGLIWNFFKS